MRSVRHDRTYVGQELTLNPFRHTLGQVLELIKRPSEHDPLAHCRITNLLHQSISNSHSGELSSSTMSSLLTVPAQPRDLAEVKLELLSEPVDSITRSVCEDLDQIISGEFTG